MAAKLPVVSVALLLGCLLPPLHAGDPGAQDNAAAPSSAPASASAPASDDAGPKSILEWDGLTGDWGGWRDKLQNKGLTFSLDWTGGMWVNARGGLNTERAVAYNNLAQFTFEFDTEKAELWKGGQFHILAEERHGPQFGARHVGDIFGLDVWEASDRTQVSEYWWRQSLLDDKVWFKLGKMDCTVDFATPEHGLEFLNGSIAYLANAPQPTFPDDALGAALGLEPCDWLYAAGGIYDFQGRGGTWGFDTAFHGPDYSMTMFEVGSRPKFKVGERVLPGTYRVGGWYTSAPEDVFFNDLGGRRRQRTHRGNASVYVSCDQVVYKESDNPEDEQGLALFFLAGWAPPQYNEIAACYSGGMQWIGLVPTRDSDVLGLGFVHGTISSELQTLEGRFSETALETFYKFYITPWVSLRPDVQYILSPGGDGRDALVFGLRMQVSF